MVMLVLVMNYLEILKQLDDRLTLKEFYSFSQDDVNNILKICIDNGWKEKAWRIVLTLSNQKYDFSRLAQYYIDVLDPYYLMELIYKE